jgi:hypothetical protein
MSKITVVVLDNKTIYQMALTLEWVNKVLEVPPEAIRELYSKVLMQLGKDKITRTQEWIKYFLKLEPSKITYKVLKTREYHHQEIR